MLPLIVVSVGGAAGRSSASSTANTYWEDGVQAVLPAHAATGNHQVVTVSSVSCTSAGNCSAVGSYRNEAGRPEGLLLTETGGYRESGLEAVLPPGAAVADQLVDLNSVSCSSAGNCSAVGTYYDNSGAEGLLLTETAGNWAPGVEATLPANAGEANQQVWLDSVSCTSAGNCIAVGSYSDGSDAQALLLAQTAGNWETGVEAALPANAAATGQAAGLSSVSCSSAGNCSAVGGYQDNSGNGPGLLLTETAGTWGTGVEATLPANAATTEQFVDLTSVSCASPGNCGAVGTYNNDTHSNDAVLLTEAAGTWTAGVKAALPANGAADDQVDLNAVSCPSTEAVMERHRPYVAGRLLSVSCSSAQYCSAVGGFEQVKGALFNSSRTPPCLVPTLKGRPVRVAKEAIMAHDCSVGKITRATSRSVKRGRVISQRPRAGTRLDRGAKASLVVSAGKGR